METKAGNFMHMQKAGGLAALYLALAYVAAMPYFLLLVDYPGASTAELKLALVLDHYPSMYAMYLATYVVFGFALGILVLALYDRLKTNAPALARVAAAMGLLWSIALTLSGMVFTYGMTAIVGIATTDLAQASAAWRAIEPIALGLGGAGGEILGGLWVLLVSFAALRSGALPKAFSALGLFIGAAGILSAAPPLRDAGMAFGLMQIPWFVWLGIALLRTKPAEADTPRP